MSDTDLKDWLEANRSAESYRIAQKAVAAARESVSALLDKHPHIKLPPAESAEELYLLLFRGKGTALRDELIATVRTEARIADAFKTHGQVSAGGRSDDELS